MRKRFRRRSNQAVTAVQLALDFDGFSYRKWGDTQTARPGDWTASETLPRGIVRRSGSVATKEGRTHYKAGDWLVSNAEDGSDAYAISAETFAQLYEADDDEASPATSG